MKTTYLQWDEYISLLEKLKGNKLRLLMAFQGMCGLRVGDVLSLKWGDVLNRNEIVVREQKTKKIRPIYLNTTITKIIQEEYKGQNNDVYVFKSNIRNNPMSVSYINRALKKLFKQYEIEYSDKVSSHLFRKTFGRRYMDVNDWSDKALLLLNEVYGHSTIAITKIYLGIRDEEIRNVYKSLVA